MANPKSAQQALQQQIAELQAQLAEYDGLEQENTTLRVQVSSLQASLLAATQQLADATTAIANLTAAFEAYKASHPDPQPEPEPEPEPEPSDWATRSANRIFARPLASADATDANLAARHPNADVCVWTPDTGTTDNYTEPVIDAFGLRFDVETGKGQGDWVFKFPKPFGANSSLYLQWQWRCNRAFLDTVFRMASGGYPGIKLAIVSTFAASSSSNKLVVSTMDQHKFPYLYRYDANGNTSSIEPAIGNPPTDFDWQPKQGKAPTCLYSVVNKTPQGQAVPGCDTLVADEWITFDLEMLTGDLIPGTNTWDCSMRLWMTIAGVKKLVVDYGKATPGYRGRNAGATDGAWFNPYMTDRDGAQTFPVTPSVWYRQVILDDKPIPPPAGTVEPEPVPTPNPTPDPVPTPDPSSFIPAPGTFAEFTLNTPQDVGMGVGTLANWCGGTPIPDYGTMGAVAYHGGREHSAQSFCQKQQAVYLIDYAIRRYVRKCSPVQVNLQSLLTGTPPTYVGTPNDEWGAFPDKSPGPMHTYAGLCPVPAMWNNGKPGMVRVQQSAGTSQPLMGESWAATWLYDLTKDTHKVDDPAITRLTGNAQYHLVPSTPTQVGIVSDAPTACIDTIRGGWWSFQRTSAGLRGLSFTFKDGVIKDFAATGLDLAGWSSMHHFADDDILCVICDEPKFGANRFGTVKLLRLSDPHGAWVTVLPALADDPSMVWGVSGVSISAGYIGPRWSSLLGAFVGLHTRFNSTTKARVLKLGVPPPGQRFTGPWAWTYEDVISGDGSVAPGLADSGSQNGAWGRLVESVALRSLVWTRDVDKPGILIRLQGM